MVASREAGGRWADGALGRLAGREPAGVPAHQRLEAGVRRVADRDRPAAGPHQADGVGPAAYGLLGGAQVGAGQHQPGVEQHDGGVAALGDGLGPGRRHHDRRLRADLGQHGLPRGRRPHRRRREGPAELLGGAGVADDRCPQAAVAADRAGPAPGGRCRTSRTAAPRPPAGWPAGPGSTDAAGGACGSARRPARRRSRGGGSAPAPARLRAPSPTTSCTADGMRVPRANGSRASSASLAPATRTVTRSRSRSRGTPSSCAQPERSRWSASTERAKPPSSGGGALALGAEQQGLAGVRVRRPRLGVEVVAVVPDHDQAQVVHRRERGRAGADHHPARAPRDRQEVAVAAGRAGLGGQRDVVALPQHRRQRAGRRGRRPWRRARTAARRGPSRRTSPRRRGRAAAASRRRVASPRRPAGTRRPRGGGGTPRPAGGRTRPRPPPGRRTAAGTRPGPARRARWRRAAAARPGAARRCGCRRSGSARSPARAATAGLSTGSALTTRRSGASRPAWSDSRAAGQQVAADLLAGEAHLDPGARARRRRPSPRARGSRRCGRGGPAARRRAPARPGRPRPARPPRPWRRAAWSPSSARPGPPPGARAAPRAGRGRSRAHVYQCPYPRGCRHRFVSVSTLWGLSDR